MDMCKYNLLNKCSGFLTLLFLIVVAGTYSPNAFPDAAEALSQKQDLNAKSHLQYYATMSGGYGQWGDVVASDGQTAIIRLAMGTQYGMSRFVALGAELSIQTGNRMRIHTANAVDVIGSQPVYLSIKSSTSMLLTLSLYPIDSSVFVFAKGGVAYLNAMVDSMSIPNTSKFLPEAQVGFGIPLRHNVHFISYYQNIFGHNPVLSNFDITNGTASLKQLPMLQAGFIGLQMTF